jgi:hypothetical protein
MREGEIVSGNKKGLDPPSPLNRCSRHSLVLGVFHHTLYLFFSDLHIVSFFSMLRSNFYDFLFIMALNYKATFRIAFNFFKFFRHGPHLPSAIICDQFLLKVNRLLKKTMNSK